MLEKRVHQNPAPPRVWGYFFLAFRQSKKVGKPKKYLHISGQELPNLTSRLVWLPAKHWTMHDQGLCNLLPLFMMTAACSRQNVYNILRFSFLINTGLRISDQLCTWLIRWATATDINAVCRTTVAKVARRRLLGRFFLPTSAWTNTRKLSPGTTRSFC